MLSTPKTKIAELFSRVFPSREKRVEAAARAEAARLVEGSERVKRAIDQVFDEMRKRGENR